MRPKQILGLTRLYLTILEDNPIFIKLCMREPTGQKIAIFTAKCASDNNGNQIRHVQSLHNALLGIKLNLYLNITLSAVNLNIMIIR